LYNNPLHNYLLYNNLLYNALFYNYLLHSNPWHNHLLYNNSFSIVVLQLRVLGPEVQINRVRYPVVLPKKFVHVTISAALALLRYATKKPSRNVSQTTRDLDLEVYKN
jgi:hypothetical protein